MAATLGTLGTILATVLITQMFWLKNHISEWERQEARFLAAHEEGRHGEAISIYKAEHDAPLSPYNVRLHNKRNRLYMVTAGESYERLGKHELARTHYLGALGWTETQLRAYCALDRECDPRELARIQTGDGRP